MESGSVVRARVRDGVTCAGADDGEQRLNVQRRGNRRLWRRLARTPEAVAGRPVGRSLPWERRANQSCQARPEEALLRETADLGHCQRGEVRAEAAREEATVGAARVEARAEAAREAEEKVVVTVGGGGDFERAAMP